MWLVATDGDSTDKEHSILAKVLLGSGDEKPTEESLKERECVNSC